VSVALAPVAAPDLPTSPGIERAPLMPAGFVAGAATVGIKASGRPDLAIVATAERPGGRVPAAVAAVFTPNAFAAAPVRLSRSNLAATGTDEDGSCGWAHAVVVTSGSANAATGAAGDADQARVLETLAQALGCAPTSTLAMSTGIIGMRLPLDRVLPGIDRLVDGGLEATDDALAATADAMRTTDSRPKVASAGVSLPDVDGGPVAVRVTGIAKGVGMIHPRMATMLSIVLTDAVVEPSVLRDILRPAAARTWNQLSVDGDTSTNDTVFLLASGASPAAPVLADSPAAARLAAAVEAVARDLARQQAADGEGATTLLTAVVRGGTDDAEARAVARAIVSSSLVKAAVHGRDPNWGRLVGAAGNARLADAPVLRAAGIPTAAADARAGSPARVEPDRLRVSICGTTVFDGPAGGPVGFDREAVRSAMSAPEVVVELDLGLGDGVGEAFGCDLTEEYVRENSEYTT